MRVDHDPERPHADPRSGKFRQVFVGPADSTHRLQVGDRVAAARLRRRPTAGRATPHHRGITGLSTSLPTSASFGLAGSALVAAGLIGGLVGALVVPAAAATSPVRDASSVFAQMSEAQRVGQLFMVGTPATVASSRTMAEIGRYHVGNIILTGRSYGGTRTPQKVAAAMQSRTTTGATSRVRLLVSTDQEGGLVQVLHGAGISEMPTALGQGGLFTARLRSNAGVWARQLRASGVNMNLAPVMDTVPSPTAARHNPPIGEYRREFGFTVARVASHGTAFAEGMAANGVAATIKHFPGLGRVTANTDVSAGVTDRTTRRGDPYLTPFKTAIATSHVPFVMMSSAYYARLDRKHPAAFSPSHHPDRAARGPRLPWRCRLRRSRQHPSDGPLVLRRPGREVHRRRR